jgi:AcrR family transcriptional regulator
VSDDVAADSTGPDGPVPDSPGPDDADRTTRSRVVPVHTHALPLSPHSAGLFAAEPERADAARNRRLLLAAAHRLMATQPVSSLTMEAVAHEAGVGKGTVFRRFGSRTGLMIALLDHSEAELQQGFLSGPPPLGPGAPPLERLIAYGRARLEMTVTHLDVLLEADSAGGSFLSHPVWAASTTHVGFLLGLLGLGPRVEVLTVAIQTPLNASAVAHMRNVVGLDTETIFDQWEAMVRLLVSGARAAL